MAKKSRVDSHFVETKTRDIIQKKIDSFYENGDALMRQLTGQDYGIDYLLELFEDGIPTGKIALLQIKGTSNEIKALKTSNDIPCKSVSYSTMRYAIQSFIPMMLIYLSIQNEDEFYYIDLHSILDDKTKNKIEKGQEKYTVRIPLQNKAVGDLNGFFDVIRTYYAK